MSCMYLNYTAARHTNNFDNYFLDIKCILQTWLCTTSRVKIVRDIFSFTYFTAGTNTSCMSGSQRYKRSLEALNTLLYLYGSSDKTDSDYEKHYIQMATFPPQVFPSVHLWWRLNHWWVDRNLYRPKMWPQMLPHLHPHHFYGLLKRLYLLTNFWLMRDGYVYRTMVDLCKP